MALDRKNWPQEIGEYNEEEINHEKKGCATTSAEIFVLRVIQSDTLSGDCKRIKILNSSIDKFGFIRLKTRISENPNTMNFRLPKVLSDEHPVVRKLMLDLHRKSCHVGMQGQLSLIREKY